MKNIPIEYAEFIMALAESGLFILVRYVGEKSRMEYCEFVYTKLDGTVTFLNFTEVSTAGQCTTL